LTIIKVPKVTIGICVKNSEGSIEDAIKSIISQDYPHELIEAVFVDDGSTDRTFSIINNFLPKMNMKCKVFHHEWCGLGYSRNVVVDNATGKYIIWVDGDMSLSGDFVRKQVDFMDENPDVAIGKGRYGILPSMTLVAFLEDVEALVQLLDHKKQMLSKPLGTAGAIYRVEAIRKVGGFKVDLKGAGEDIEIEYRIGTSGWLLETTSAEFYEKRKNSWKGLWNEYFWQGAGGRKIFRKISPYTMLSRMFPPTIFLTVVTRSCSAYRLTAKKAVFLLPLQWIFKRVAWVLGFVLNTDQL
jgi:glycosyltransferase involved in cell wall biosynthesis